MPIGFFGAKAVTHSLHIRSAVADRTKVAAEQRVSGAGSGLKPDIGVKQGHVARVIAVAIRAGGFKMASARDI